MAEERVVIVTGATGGLGRVVSRVFAAAGFRLMLTARHESALESLAKEIDAEGRVLVQPADLTVPEDVEQLVVAVRAAWGRTDVLLNLAGGWRGGVRLADLTDDQWERMLAINLISAFRVNRAVLPHMLEQGDGRIINIGSRAVERPGAGQAPYNVAKAGVVALTRSIAADYGKRGIRANAILPGTIDTAANREAMPDAERSSWVDPEQLAHTMLFLVGDAGRAINGTEIAVYGGE